MLRSDSPDLVVSALFPDLPPAQAFLLKQQFADKQGGAGQFLSGFDTELFAQLIRSRVGKRAFNQMQRLDSVGANSDNLNRMAGDANFFTNIEGAARLVNIFGKKWQEWQDLPAFRYQPELRSGKALPFLSEEHGRTFGNWLLKVVATPQWQIQPEQASSLLETIGYAWPVLSRSQRQLPIEELYKRAAIARDLGIVNDATHRPLSGLVEEIAAQVPWQQAVSIEAFKSLNDPDSFSPIAEFESHSNWRQLYDARRAALEAPGRESVLARSRDVARIFQSYHPKAHPIDGKILQFVLESEASPAQYIKGLKLGAFKDAFAYLMPAAKDNFAPLNSLDIAVIQPETYLSAYRR